MYKWVILPINLVVFFKIFVFNKWFISPIVSKALVELDDDDADDDAVLVRISNPSSNDWNNSPLPNI